MNASEKGRMGQFCQLGRWPSSTPSSINTIVFRRHINTHATARTHEASDRSRETSHMLGDSR